MTNRKNLRERIDGEQLNKEDNKGPSSDIIQELMLMTSTTIPYFKDQVFTNVKKYETWYQDEQKREKQRLAEEKKKKDEEKRAKKLEQDELKKAKKLVQDELKRKKKEELAEKKKLKAE